MFKFVTKTVQSGFKLFGEQQRFATKQSAGGARFGKQSQRKRRGIKKSGGSVVKSGQIIVRQKGSKWWPGYNVGQGRDFTLYALNPGKVEFYYDELYQRTYVSVIADREKLQEKNGLPIRWLDATRFKNPKVVNFQVKYQLDRACIGRKGQRLKSLRRKPSISTLNKFRKAKVLRAETKKTEQENRTIL
jgi:large subunit ribosomal protein L27